MTDDLKATIERCRGLTGPGDVDLANASPECLADLLKLARAYMAIPPHGLMFTVSPEMAAKFETWAATRPVVRNRDATGFRYQFMFSPTSLGMQITCKDCATGDTVDLSDDF